MNLIAWYYPVGFLQTAKLLWYVLLWLSESLSLRQLAKTLFSPWRRDITSWRRPNLQQLIQALAFNFISRLFGALVRSIVLLGGSITLLLTSLVSAVLLILLLLLPISLPLLILAALVLILGNPLAPLGYLAASLALLTALLAGWIIKKEYLENPPLPLPLDQLLSRFHQNLAVNLAPYLSAEARKVFLASPSLKALRKNLLQNPKARFIFNRAGIHPSALPASAPKLNVDVEKFLLVAGEQAVREKRPRIEIGDLIFALSQFDPSFQRALKQAHLNSKDLNQIVHWQIHLWKIIHPPSILTQPHKFKTNGGIAKNWTAGYTPKLDEVSRDITDEVTNSQLDSIYQAHQANIHQIETVLARPGKHNCLLVGSAGVGKRQIILGLAREILIGKTFPQLAHKRLVELDLNLLLSTSQSANQLETKLVAVLNEAVNAGNIILFIDQIERLFYGHKYELGAINAIPLLLPFLNSPRFQLLATSLPSSYHRFLEEQPALLASFEKIDIKEPSSEQTLRILEEITPSIENKFNLIFTYLSLKEIILAADRLFPLRRFPQKAIDLAAELSSFAASYKIGLITPEIVDQYLSKKTRVPIGKLGERQKKLLINLEAIIHQNLINQSEAVKAVANALRRSQAGVSNPDKPLGSFLFVGPTGVGKTALAKTLANHFFGSEKHLLRLDMSEFQQTKDLDRLLGNPTSQAPGRLVSQIRQQPYTLLLLDEFEKAHPNILNLFLQILDEGRVTDSFGKIASFKNALIIATSNAGSNFIRQEINRRTPLATLQKKLLNYIQNEHIFSPELLNRFSAVVAFRPLNIYELKEITSLMIQKINQRLDGKVKVKITPSVQERLARIGQNPAFGARALERVIQDKIENLIANKLLTNQISPEQTLVITEKMIQ